MRAEETQPLLPDRAGVKKSFMTILHFIIIFLSRLHLRYASRDSIVDARIAAVSICVQCHPLKRTG